MTNDDNQESWLSFLRRRTGSFLSSITELKLKSYLLIFFLLLRWKKNINSKAASRFTVHWMNGWTNIWEVSWKHISHPDYKQLVSALVATLVRVDLRSWLLVSSHILALVRRPLVSVSHHSVVVVLLLAGVVTLS